MIGNNKTINKLYYKALSILLCFVLFASFLPQNAKASAVQNYALGIVNKGGLNVRNSVGGKTIQQLNRGEVVQILQTLTDNANVPWYAVYIGSNQLTGYVQASYITLMNQADASKYVTSHSNAISTNSISMTVGNGRETILGYLVTTVSGINLRDKADGGKIAKVNKNEEYAFTQKTQKGNYTWYRIYHAVHGYSYLRGDTVRETSITSTAPISPGNTITQPQQTPSAFGSITLVIDKVNIRKTAELHGTRIGRVGLGATYAVLEQPTQNDGYTWYKITANTITGYVRSDMLRFNNDANPQAGLTTPTPVNPNTNITTQGFGYVITTIPAASLRSGPNGTVLISLSQNQTHAVIAPAIISSGYTWYPINVNGISGYLRSDSVNYYTGNATPLYPTPVPNTPNTFVPQQNSNVLITIVDKVNLRVSPQTGTKAAYNVPLGTTFPYIRTAVVDGREWYKIAYQATELWVMGKTVRILGANETPNLPLPSVTTAPNQNPNGYIVTVKGAVNFRESAGGKTITSIPNRGTILEYFGTSVSRNYTWYKVKYNNQFGFVRGDTVKISDNKGNILDNNNTNPNNPGNSNNINNKPNTTPNSSQTIGNFQLFRPVVKSDWNTGEMNALWPRGSSFQVMDVITGKSFMMYRWAGGSHVDGEPLTKRDTQILCEIYGVKRASDIAKTKSWRRPMWVSINGKTYAASLYGIPHNPAGNTIKDNDYDGQMCLHFTNSRVHRTNIVDKDHAKAIQDAVNKGQ